MGRVRAAHIVALHAFVGASDHFFLKSEEMPSSVARWDARRSSRFAWVRRVRRRPADTSRSLMTRARFAIVVARRAIRMSGCLR